MDATDLVDEEAPEYIAPSASTRVSRAARRKAARKRAIIAVIVAAVVLATIGSGAAYASTRPQPLDKRYVTVAAATGDLTQTETFTGTVAKATQASVSFPAAGTVTGVQVTVGQHVDIGQPLASMDTTALQQAVNTAQANLDQANLTLNQLNSSTSSTSTSSDGSGSGNGGGTKPDGSQGQTTDQLAKTIAAAQAALAKAQAQAATDTAAMQAACADVLPGIAPVVPTPSPSDTPTDSPTATPTDTPTDSPTDTPTDSLTDSPSDTPSDTPTDTPSDTPTETPTDSPSDTPTGTPTDSPADTVSGGSAADCLAAVQTMMADNQAVSQASTQMSTLTTQLQKAMTTALQTAQAQCTTQLQTAVQQAMQQARGSQSQGALASGATGGTASQQTTAEIAVEQAQTALDQAQSNLDNATITAPVSGTVATVPFTVGGAVSASAAITIIGDGGIQITLSVPVAKIAGIKEGQSAQITQVGVGQASGTVSMKALAPSSSGGSNYTVEVAASGADAVNLLPGVSASVVITIGQLNSAVVVPISAVVLDSSAATSGTVQVLANNTLSTVPVTIAAIGATQVAIGTGIKVGDRVVVADTQEALPSSLTGLTRALGGGGTTTRVYAGGGGGGNFGGGGGNFGGNQPGAQGTGG